MQINLNCELIDLRPAYQTIKKLGNNSMIKNFLAALSTAIFVLGLEFVFFGPENIELAKLVFMTVCTFLLISVIERKNRKNPEP